MFISYLLYLIFVIFVYKKELKDDIKDFNIRKLIKYIPVYLIGIALMYISNYVITNITHLNISSNESLVRKNIKLYPLYMSFLTLIYAPIVEEITFRKTFKNIIKDNLLFVILSGFVFGLIHLNATNISYNDLLMIIPYIIMGIDLSYIYYKSNNIFTTITIHMIHNLVLLIIYFIGG